MYPRRFLSLFRQSFDLWNKHNVPRLGAALAFYTIVSISPLVILAVAIASLVFSKSAAQSHLLDQVQGLVGWQGRQSVQTVLVFGQKTFTGIFSTIIGLITLLLGASGVFAELRGALNTIWEVEPPATSGLRSLVREKFFSFGMVLSVGFVLLVSLVVSAILTAFSKFLSGVVPVPGLVLGSFDYLVSLFGTAVLFAFILKYVPETRVEWRDVRVGAVVTAVLFNIGKWLLALYLAKSSPGSSYGAAGSLVVLVVWVYYSAQIFFFGAEFTHVHAISNRREEQRKDPGTPAGTQVPDRRTAA